MPEQSIEHFVCLPCLLFGLMLCEICTMPEADFGSSRCREGENNPTGRLASSSGRRQLNQEISGTTHFA